MADDEMAYGFQLRPKGLFGELVSIEGTPYEAVLTSIGWRARETPIGFKRTRLLTTPGESPADAVLLLIRGGYLAPPPGVHLQAREWKRQGRSR